MCLCVYARACIRANSYYMHARSLTRIVNALNSEWRKQRKKEEIIIIKKKNGHRAKFMVSLHDNHLTYINIDDIYKMRSLRWLIDMESSSFENCSRNKLNGIPIYDVIQDAKWKDRPVYYTVNILTSRVHLGILAILCCYIHLTMYLILRHTKNLVFFSSSSWWPCSITKVWRGKKKWINKFGLMAFVLRCIKRAMENFCIHTEFLHWHEHRIHFYMYHKCIVFLLFCCCSSSHYDRCDTC